MVPVYCALLSFWRVAALGKALQRQPSQVNSTLNIERSSTLFSLVTFLLFNHEYPMQFIAISLDVSDLENKCGHVHLYLVRGSITLFRAAWSTSCSAERSRWSRSSSASTYSALPSETSSLAKIFDATVASFSRSVASTLQQTGHGRRGNRPSTDLLAACYTLFVELRVHLLQVV